MSAAFVRASVFCWSRKLPAATRQPTFKLSQRLNSTTSTPATSTTATATIDEAISSAASDVSKVATPSNIRWETVDQPMPTFDTFVDIAEKFVATGPVLPFWELNFLQKILAPYTYSIMYYMDTLLVYMPWWATIVATTATARLVLLPMHIKQIKIGIKSHNLMPQTQRLQSKMNEYMSSGDSFNAASTRSKLMLLYKDNGISVRERLVPLLVQTPVFITTFFLLRRLTTDNLDSMTTGGAAWFTNLCQYDPYYILPLLTSSSMFLLFEFGMEGGMTPTGQMMPAMRWFLRLMPMGIFYFTYQFPAALTLFWLTNNTFTLVYALIFQRTIVKTFFNIPDRIEHSKTELPLSAQTFSSQLQTARDGARAKQTSYDIRRLDDIAFRKAGIGPIKKTYKDPPK